MELTIEQTHRLCTDVLGVQGHSPAHAGIIADVLLYAQLRNPAAGQGLAKLRAPGMPVNSNATKMRRVYSSPSSVHIDGGGNPGIVVMEYAKNTLLKKMRTNGVACVTTTNNNPSVSASSTGAIGYFAESIAKEGYVAWVMSKPSVALTAPYGSVDRIFSTNPIAFGFPTGGAPTVVDLTTAASSFFSVLEAKANEESLAAGVGYDAEGKPTVNPADIIAGGSLATFGGARGSAIAYAVEGMAAAFGASYGGQHSERGWFNMLVACNPNIGEIVSKESSGAAVHSLNEVIRHSRPVQGVAQAYAPGDRSLAREIASRGSGTVEIADGLYSNLMEQLG